MEFCCTLDELSKFSYSAKNENAVTGDYINLNKENNYVQQEFDFEACAKIVAETSKKEIVKKELIKSPKAKPTLKERNKELMIKYKYDNITDDELSELYTNLEKLIFKIVRSNYVTENFGDVCNEIWRRIAKYKHKWDENNGDYVTTWVGKVAINVIQTLRKRSMLYRARNVSYDGMVTFGKGGEEKEVEMDKLIADNKDDSGEKRKVFYENIMSCFDVFDETEKKIVELFLEGDTENLVIDDENRTYKRRYASASFIKKKLSLTQNEYNKYIKSIGEKYVSKQEQDPNDGIDYGMLYRIF